MPRVLIASYPIRNQPGLFRELLTETGFTPVDIEEGATLSEEQLRAVLPTVEAVVAGSETFSAGVLDTAPNLRVIARTGVGYDAVDVAAATERGIVVTITPGTNQESVAEQTFGLLLGLTRKIAENDRTIKGGGWDRAKILPVRGLTLGLIGLGRIGKAVAERAVAFEMRVIAHDPAPPTDIEGRLGIERVDLDELLERADVVSLHLPITAETRSLINRERLARMKPGSWLINTSRGGLVVEADLHEALASGHLAGAGLDVLNQEPPEPDNPLLGLSNVVLSPHVGGIDTRAMADMATLAARCIIDLHQGRWPSDCVVNRELAGKFRW